jgi:hypothetical protein
MVILPKKYSFHGKFLNMVNMALMKKIPMLLRNFFFHVLDTITQPVLGKFPIKVKIPMNISNSVCSLSDIPKMGPKMGKVSRFQQRSSQSVRSHIIFSIIFKLENIVFVRFLLMIQLKTFVTGWQHCIRPQRNH